MHAVCLSRNLTPECYKFAHLTCILWPHYLEKCKRVYNVSSSIWHAASQQSWPKARFPAKRNARNARNATDCVRKVHKKHNKRKKITQSKTLRKTRFPSKRNARNRQPMGMVDLNSQSSNQPIKCLHCLRFSFTQRTHRTQRNPLRFLAVLFYATHATQSVALRALRALRLAGNQA